MSTSRFVTSILVVSPGTGTVLSSQNHIFRFLESLLETDSRNRNPERVSGANTRTQLLETILGSGFYNRYPEPVSEDYTKDCLQRNESCSLNFIHAIKVLVLINGVDTSSINAYKYKKNYGYTKFKCALYGNQ